MKFLAALLFLSPLASAAAVTRDHKAITYDGFKVFRIATHHDPEVVKQRVSLLSTISLNSDHGEYLDIAVAPEDVEAFESIGLEFKVMHDDLGADIAIEGEFEQYPKRGLKSIPGLDWFNSYHSYEDHVQYFKDLHAALSSNSELVSAGKSYQGRDLFGIHLWGEGGKGSRPAVYFHGTVHAREWISTMVVEYLTYQLVSGYGDDDLISSILNAYDFYILPIVNPDGFVYTQTTDRLWRKNRQPRGSDTSCIGTDINRNWPFKWTIPGGASTNPCSDIYKGQSAGDTVEMNSLVSFTSSLSKGQGIKLYIDWHSYGQYILYPWGYDCTLAAPERDRQDTLAAGLSATINESYGSNFQYGGSCSTLYATTGVSTDYMTGIADADLAWTIELRPESGSEAGFVLPVDKILPAAKEQWEGMKYLLVAM